MWQWHLSMAFCVNSWDPSRMTFHALVCYSISFHVKSKTVKIKLVDGRLWSLQLKTFMTGYIIFLYYFDIKENINHKQELYKKILWKLNCVPLKMVFRHQCLTFMSFQKTKRRRRCKSDVNSQTILKTILSYIWINTFFTCISTWGQFISYSCMFNLIKITVDLLRVRACLEEVRSDDTSSWYDIHPEYRSFAIVTVDSGTRWHKNS